MFLVKKKEGEMEGISFGFICRQSMYLGFAREETVYNHLRASIMGY